MMKFIPRTRACRKEKKSAWRDKNVIRCDVNNARPVRKKDKDKKDFRHSYAHMPRVLRWMADVMINQPFAQEVSKTANRWIPVCSTIRKSFLGWK
jgi:hypothetical protein